MVITAASPGLSLAEVATINEITALTAKAAANVGAFQKTVTDKIAQRQTELVVQLLGRGRLDAATVLATLN